MTVVSDASLRGKSKALAKRYGLSSQEVIQMYLFERFLVRLSQSPYRDNFILKGGLLISSLLGVASRTTMDMDATLRSMDLREPIVRDAVESICRIDAEDGISFEYERCTPIRQDDVYGGLRVHLRAKLGRMDAPMKIDVSTGDVITPASIEYPFPMMFDDGKIGIMSYPLTTCLAEKFEAVVHRGVTTTRARDLYDIAKLFALHGATLDWKQMGLAIQGTSKHRGTWEAMKDYEQICDELAESSEIERLWTNYIESNRYAAEIDLNKAIEAVRELGRKALGNLAR